MAKPEPIKAVCERICVMVCERRSAHSRERHTYTVLPSGNVVCDSEEWTLSDNGWKKLPPYHRRVGMLKESIRHDARTIFDSMQDWADRLRNKGWDAEIQ